MRLVVAASILLASTPALADPCAVTITRAPEEVRAAIETWVAAEPDCTTTAEVRVVATDGGYYVIAIDGAGRVHERIAPDAQSAAVLVVSWIADDSTATAPAPAPTPPAPAPEAAAYPGESVTPPSAAPVVAPMVSVKAPAKAIRGWFAAGGTLRLGRYGAAGIGFEGTQRYRGPWGLALSGELLSNELVPRYPEDPVFTAYATVLSATYLRTRGAFTLRLGAGVGAALTTVNDPWSGMRTSTLRPISEVTAFGAVKLTRRFVLVGGPVVTIDLGDQTLGQTHVGAFAGIGVTTR
jgi:hypothetical protein